MTPGADGIAVIDKPAGWTSHDVVAKVRGILHTKRVGHSGTLDPDATGVLLLGVGRVTRLLRYLTELPKSYVGEVVLGTETDTLDASGNVVATHDMAAVTGEDVARAAEAFLGEIDQVPPMVSAVQIGGRRLHDLARQGIEVDRPPRRVTVYRFAVDPVAVAAGVFRIEVDCGSGTYVRSLAADLGRSLGGGAHLRNLRRTAIGSFSLAEARAIESVEVLAPAVALRDFPSVTARGETVDAVRHGKVLAAGALGEDGDGPWAVLDEEGSLLAMYEHYQPGTVKPSVVLVG